jgi:hypothetical protein
LAELIGARLVRKLDSLDNWVRLSDQGGLAVPAGRADDPELCLALRGSLRAGWPFLVRGPAAVFEPTTARPVGQLLKPYRTLRQQQGKEGADWPMSPEAPVGPAILVQQLGQGAVLTFTCSPDFATASDHHIVEARRLLRNAVRFLNPKPIVEISAPATVEAVVTDDAATRTVRVHLLGYNSPPQTTPARERPYVLPRPIEDAPMYRVALASGRPLKKVLALSPSTILNRRGARVEATVNDIHEILLLSY